LRVKTPVTTGITFPVLQGIETLLNGIVPFKATNTSLDVTNFAIAIPPY
jgi:hypothetical protein